MAKSTFLSQFLHVTFILCKNIIQGYCTSASPSVPGDFTVKVFVLGRSLCINSSQNNIALEVQRL